MFSFKNENHGTINVHIYLETNFSSQASESIDHPKNKIYLSWKKLRKRSLKSIIMRQMANACLPILFSSKDVRPSSISWTWYLVRLLAVGSALLFLKQRD